MIIIIMIIIIIITTMITIIITIIVIIIIIIIIIIINTIVFIFCNSLCCLHAISNEYAYANGNLIGRIRKIINNIMRLRFMETENGNDTDKLGDYEIRSSSEQDHNQRNANLL